MFLCFARYASVTSGDPSLTMRCTVIKLLKTTVHVESRSRCCSALKTSPTPASPACVATRMCSMYFVFGGAACRGTVRCQLCVLRRAPTISTVASAQTYLDLRRALYRFLKRARHLCWYSPMNRGSLRTMTKAQLQLGSCIARLDQEGTSSRSPDEGFGRRSKLVWARRGDAIALSGNLYS